MSHKQMTLAMQSDKGFEKHRKPTRRDEFLAQMDKVVPWAELCALIAPVYPQGRERGGRRPIGLERMLRIYFLQQWYDLSDPAVEEALYDSQAMRRFVGIDLGREGAPDETTVCKFRHRLEAHELGQRIFERVWEHLEANGLKVSRGTIVDASIIAPPLDQEQGQGARPGHAPDEEGQPVVLRHEGAHWRGQPQQADSRGGGHRGERARLAGAR